MSRGPSTKNSGMTTSVLRCHEPPPKSMMTSWPQVIPPSVSRPSGPVKPFGPPCTETSTLIAGVSAGPVLTSTENLQSLDGCDKRNMAAVPATTSMTTIMTPVILTMVTVLLSSVKHTQLPYLNLSGGISRLEASLVALGTAPDVAADV